jgi:hypothetical protein
MGSPDNRRKADDSCRALGVGRSMSALLHDGIWTVRVLLERAACEALQRRARSPGREGKSMPRISNARTIADIEFVIDAPSIGSGLSAWTSRGVDCLRERHRFDGQAYSYIFDVLQLRFAGDRRRGWHAVVITELWRFAGSKSEPHPAKSLRVIGGRSADILSWMRTNRSAKLDEATSSGRRASRS